MCIVAEMHCVVVFAMRMLLLDKIDRNIEKEKS